jgi:hypothetical protein
MVTSKCPTIRTGSVASEPHEVSASPGSNVSGFSTKRPCGTIAEAANPWCVSGGVAARRASSQGSAMSPAVLDPAHGGGSVESGERMRSVSQTAANPPRSRPRSRAMLLLTLPRQATRFGDAIDDAPKVSGNPGPRKPVKGSPAGSESV